MWHVKGENDGQIYNPKIMMRCRKMYISTTYTYLQALSCIYIVPDSWKVFKKQNMGS